MKKTRVFLRLLLFMSFFAVAFGFIYCLGLQRKPVKYGYIPEETLGWLDSLDTDGGIKYVGQGPYDWDNDTDHGQKLENGWTALDSDPNFIIYYKDDAQGEWYKNAVLTLRAANETKGDLLDVMGWYPSASSSYGRKLPIYLPSTKEEYILTGTELLGRESSSFRHSSGVHIQEVGMHGFLCKGILLVPECFDPYVHPKYTYEYVLRHEMNHFAYFASLDYTKMIDHKMWEYEGLADFFSYRQGDMTATIAGRDSINFIVNRCHFNENFPNDGSIRYAPYWAGESFYKYVRKNYGDEGVSQFITAIKSFDGVTAITHLLGDTDSVKVHWVSDLEAYADAQQAKR